MAPLQRPLMPAGSGGQRNTSASACDGVLGNSRVCRGRSLTSRAMASRSVWVRVRKSRRGVGIGAICRWCSRCCRVAKVTWGHRGRPERRWRPVATTRRLLGAIKAHTAGGGRQSHPPDRCRSAACWLVHEWSSEIVRSAWDLPKRNPEVRLEDAIAGRLAALMGRICPQGQSIVVA
jgi:hypothetical protein